MSSKQRKGDLPAGAVGRVRSAASGLYKPPAVTAKKKVKPVVGQYGVGAKTVLAGHGSRTRKPGPAGEKKPAKPQPYSLPSFLGMFDLPSDSSERVKSVVRGQDDAKVL